MRLTLRTFFYRRERILFHRHHTATETDFQRVWSIFRRETAFERASCSKRTSLPTRRCYNELGIALKNWNLSILKYSKIPLERLRYRQLVRTGEVEALIAPSRLNRNQWSIKKYKHPKQIHYKCYEVEQTIKVPMLSLYQGQGHLLSQ